MTTKHKNYKGKLSLARQLPQSQQKKWRNKKLPLEEQKCHVNHFRPKVELLRAQIKGVRWVLGDRKEMRLRVHFRAKAVLGAFSDGRGSSM